MAKALSKMSKLKVGEIQLKYLEIKIKRVEGQLYGK